MVQDVQSVLHFLHPGSKLLSLLLQDFFPGFNGPVTLLDQSDILNQNFNGKPGAPHALDEFNPPDIDINVISNSTYISIYGLNEPNAFIVTQRIRRHPIAFTYFRDFHKLTSPLQFITWSRLQVKGFHENIQRTDPGDKAKAFAVRVSGQYRQDRRGRHTKNGGRELINLFF
jgi:hypothetical protein